MKHNAKLTLNEQKILTIIRARADLSSYEAICAEAKLGKAYISRRRMENPSFIEAMDKAFAQRNEKVAEKTAKEVCKFDALNELAVMAQSWRVSKYGVGPAHVRAAELYVHISGQTPEAKKIMAEIYGKMGASEFYGWNNDELDTYVRTGERPARLSAQSGSSSVN